MGAGLGTSFRQDGGVFWSILIPTIARRRVKFAALLDVLLPQAERAPARVEVVALHNNGERPLPEIRQALVDAAAGRYLSFVDDDDMVVPSYVNDIAFALLENPGADSVGFQLERAWETGGIRVRMIEEMSGPRQDGRDWPPPGGEIVVPEGEAATLCHTADCASNPIAFRVASRVDDGVTSISRKHHGWGHTFCDWSILSPTRASVVKQCSFLGHQGNAKEDAYFRDQVIGKLSGPEVYIPRVLYHYRWDPDDSVQGKLPPHVPVPRLTVTSPVFRYHEP